MPAMCFPFDAGGMDSFRCLVPCNEQQLGTWRDKPHTPDSLALLGEPWTVALHCIFTLYAMFADAG